MISLKKLLHTETAETSVYVVSYENIPLFIDNRKDPGSQDKYVSFIQNITGCKNWSSDLVLGCKRYKARLTYYRFGFR